MITKRDSNGRIAKTHGLNDHPFCAIWRAIVNRCDNPNNHAYASYGGRGITVCKEWYDPAIFIAWLESMDYQSGLQIDRIDNDAGYSPDNCRVVTPKQNSRNRRDNRRYSVHGEMLLPIEVEEKYGVKFATFKARVTRYGKTPEQALINKRKLPVFKHMINGIMMTAKDISEKYNVSASTFNSRISHGWDAERAAMTVTAPYRTT